MRQSLKKIGLAIAGLAAAALMTAATATSASAANLYTANLGTLNSLDDGEASFWANVTVSGTANPVISVTDLQNAKSGSTAGRVFSVAYDFTLGGSATSAAAVLIQSPTGFGTGTISGFAYALSGTSYTGTVVDGATLTFAGLSPKAVYELVLTGTLIGTSASFGGTVSAVPLPGALILFGSGLLGLGALGRRRVSKKTAKLKLMVPIAAIAALIALPFLAAGSASAATMETIDLGSLTVSPAGASLGLFGKLSKSGGVTAQGIYTPDMSNPAVYTTTNGSSFATAGTGVTYYYNFSVSGEEKLGLNLSSATSGLSVSLQGNGSVVPAYLAEGALQLLATLVSGVNYAIVVVDPTGVGVKSSFAGGATLTTVPIPGALVLFGSGFAALVALGRRGARNKMG